MKPPMDNQELSKVLPTLRKEFEVLSSTSFAEYESRLETVTNRALDKLEGIIDDGTLEMDPEQMVNAVATLTGAKVKMFDAKRKLLETLIKGEIMIKALEKPKDQDNSSLLEDYIAKQKNVATVSRVNSVFADIENSNS